MTAPTDAPALSIRRVKVSRALVPIVGTQPLIVHRWSEKAKRQMLDAQQGRKSPKEVRDPQADYESSLYRTETGYGFPVLGFKSAIVSAARFFGKDVTMTSLRQSIFMSGVMSTDSTTLLTPIEGEPRMREDPVRLAMNTTSLAFRGEFPIWSATLDVSYAASALDTESVLALIDAAGLGVGVGEWRPEKRGQNGTWQIDETRQLQMVNGS